MIPRESSTRLTRGPAAGAAARSLIRRQHETFPYAGRDFRLIDVHGEVAREILA